MKISEFGGSELWAVAMAAAGVLAWGWGTADGQQEYIANHQLDCYKNYTSTSGCLCNANNTTSDTHNSVSNTCAAYLTFRSSPPYYDSAATIGYLLNSPASLIAQLNNISDVAHIPKDTLLLVPLNCSCNGNYSQHLASYTLKLTYETYLLVANDTFQGLTTCQALMSQNPSHDSRDLWPGLHLDIPIRCACPSSNQTTTYGVKYLLTYIASWDDTISSIANTFGVDPQIVLHANQLSASSLIFPFTTILVPLNDVPTIHNASTDPVPPPPPLLQIAPPVDSSSGSRKWVFVGIGAAAGLSVLLFFVLLCFAIRRRREEPQKKPMSNSSSRSAQQRPPPPADPADYSALPSQWNSSLWPVSPLSRARAAIESLTVYEFEDLLEATGYFKESNKIKDGGCVYKGSFKGDQAAVKVMEGDVTGEINILKNINHANIIRLSGFCLHKGNTYLVYEYADNGSLSDWLHLRKEEEEVSLDQNGPRIISLGWKQRVQIASDVADALRYLHSYITTPYVHKNLKTSNILLDGNMRAKVNNFGMARTVNVGEGFDLTRHVIGTQGYMAPEYMEHGVVTPKLDVFAFGVVMLELLSGRKASISGKNGEVQELLSASIREVLEGENVRENLRRFMDPSLGLDYPFDLAYSMAKLATDCVASDLNSRPSMPDIFMALSKLLSSSLDWDPSDRFQSHSSGQPS